MLNFRASVQILNVVKELPLKKVTVGLRSVSSSAVIEVLAAHSNLLGQLGHATGTRLRLIK